MLPRLPCGAMLAKGLKTAQKSAPKNQVSIHMYYLWSGILYCGCGVLIIATEPQIMGFLCSIPPKGFDPVSGLCYNCSDDLLFCQKSACYQQAINITYTLEAKTPELYSFRAYSNAVRDETCTALVLGASDPVAFLVEANRELVNADPLSPWESEDCLAFHCQVMKRAIMDEPDLNALTGECSNINGAKSPDTATECSCRDVLITPEEAIILSSPTICAISDGSILRWTFQKYLSLQDECLQSALNTALTRVSETQNTETQESEACQNRITAITTVIDIYQDEEGAFLAPDDSCRFAFCHAFNASLTDELCEWGYQPTLSPDSSSPFELIAAACESIIDDFQTYPDGGVPGDVALDRVCATMIGFLEDEAPEYCLLRAESGGAAGRRLGANQGMSSSAGSKRPATQAEERCGWDGCKSRLALGQSLLPARAPTWTRARSLQDAAPSPAAALNEAMPAFTVTPWQPCKCYLPCSPGVMVRDVTCLAGENACKLPKPEVQQDCTCWHCADCSVITMLFTVQLCYFIQGAVALLVWMSFLYFEGQGEELAVSFNIPMKILGFFCKNLPSTVRVAVLVNLVQLFYVLIISWVPTSALSMYTDCNESGVLRVVVVVSLSVCIFQLVYGRFMKKHTRRPPWLYSPPRTRLPTPFKQFRHFMQQLGP